MVLKSDIADIENDADVELLVGRFYGSVRADEVLGVYFDKIAAVDWNEHIPTMCKFWGTVLFHRPGYKGNPVLPHIQLDRRAKIQRGAGLQQADFDRWICLFQATVDDLFSGPRAEQAKRGASRMAQHMVSAIADSQNPLGVVSTSEVDVAPRGYHFK